MPDSPTPEAAERQLVEDMRNAAHEHSEPAALDVPAEKTAPGAISIMRLTHKVPKASAKAFSEASKLIKKNRHADAVVFLDKAIAIDPEFADAHNDLGTQYMALGRVTDAEQEFRKAIALDGSFAIAIANLAIAEYAQGDFSAAEKEAQRALTFAPSNQTSRHLLDLIRTRRERGF